MINKHRQPRLNKKAVNPALTRLDKTADRLLRIHRDCLVPCADGEAHDNMNNCHIIAEGFLAIIADGKGKILCWPSSPRSLGRQAWKAILDGQVSDTPPYLNIQAYEPVERSKGHKDCKYTFACQLHDNKVFKPIDTVANFNPHDAETQIKLGLRTFAAYAAFYRAHKLFASRDFWKDPDTRDILKKYPQAESLAQIVRDFSVTNHPAVDRLERHLKRWQAAYASFEPNRVVSSVKTVRPALQLAATSTKNRHGCRIATTILPTNRRESTIIATAIGARNPLDILGKRWIRKAVQKEAAYMKDLLEQKPPEHWLAEMLPQFEFMYISKDDYSNEAIISAEGRELVARSAAQKVPPRARG